MSTTRSPRSVPTSRPGPWRKRSSTWRSTPAGILIRSSWKSWRGTERKSFPSANGLPIGWRSDPGPGQMTLKSTLAAVPARVTAGTEYEQSIVRLVVGAVLFLYLLPQAFITHGKTDLLFLVAMVCYLVLASVIFSWIHLSPPTSPARRRRGFPYRRGALAKLTATGGSS